MHMADKSEQSRVKSHTEYTHTRFRCRRCGVTIPEEDVDDALCVNCRSD